MKTELMVSSRNFLLTGTFPWSFSVRKDIPIEIPRDAVRAALAAGMTFVGEKNDGKVEEILNAPKVPQMMSGAELEDKITGVFAELIERNNSDDFAASGVPAHAAVSVRLGQKVSQKDVERYWRQYRKECELRDEAAALDAQG